MNQKSRQELSVQEQSILGVIHQLDQTRLKLYQERMEWQEKLEQVQAEKYRLQDEEAAGNE